MKPELVDWFRSDVRPALDSPYAVIVGGTWLLEEFVGYVANRREGGRLSIATPFVGRGIAERVCAWRDIEHGKVELSLVTSTVEDAETAWSELGQFHWRSAIIVVKPRLHAKVYSFVSSSGDGACLIGSHNLTENGAVRNFEAGVLFEARGAREMVQIILACEDQVEQLIRTSSTRFVDTLALPFGTPAI